MNFYAGTKEPHQVAASFVEVPALGPIDVLRQNTGANDLTVALTMELETSDPFFLDAGRGSIRSNVNEFGDGGGVRWRFGGAPLPPLRRPAASGKQEGENATHQTHGGTEPQR